MPQLITKYSASLDAGVEVAALAQAIHAAALAIGVFPVGGCRTRVARRDIFVVGDGQVDNRFIHIQVRFGAGRSPVVRHKAAEQIVASLKAFTATVFATQPLGLTLEIAEIDPVGALKHSTLRDVIAARQKGTTS